MFSPKKITPATCPLLMSVNRLAGGVRPG